MVQRRLATQWINFGLRRPFIFTAVNGVCIGFVGDFIAQNFEIQSKKRQDDKMNSLDSNENFVEKSNVEIQKYDYERALQIVYVRLILTPFMTIWFIKMQPLQAPMSRNKNSLQVLKKLCLNEQIFAPCFQIGFMYTMNRLKNKSHGEAMIYIQNNILDLYKSSLCYWPLWNSINFRYIPVNLQPSYAMVGALLWSCYLSYFLNSRSKGST